MNYQIITQTVELETVCQQARTRNVVMLDTEFVRTRTFYPQLGLIQLFDGDTLSLIDPLAIEEMSAFVALLQDTSVTKILHACGEDLEVFQNAFGCTPTPMIDTQIMAAFLGHGLSTGFATLVKEYQGIELDKSESRTDWLARPLTQRQLEYAAADVHYLYPLYEQLFTAIQEAGWEQAVQQECELLVQKRIRTPDLDNAYLEVKGAWLLKPSELAILKPLATWRLQYAMQHDLALNFVFKENDLLMVARLGPCSMRRMEQEKMDMRSVRRHYNHMMTLVKQAQQTPTDQYPAKIERLMDMPNYKQVFKTLKDDMKIVVQQTGLASEFLASKKQLNQLLSWVWCKECDPAQLPEVMQGWRKPLFGEKLAARLIAK